MGRARSRGSGWDGGALAPRAGPEKARLLVAAELYLTAPGVGDCQAPLGLALADSRAIVYTHIESPSDGGRLLLARLSAWSHPAGLIVFWNGAREAFHVLLRCYAREWSAQGWRIQPLATGTSIVCLILSRDRERITLCDAQSMTGTRFDTLEGLYTAFGIAGRGDEPDVSRLYRALVAYQSLLIRSFGCAIQPTLGMAAVHALRQVLPDEPRWLRPTPGLVALCRAGGAYRGGWVGATPYHGKAWRVDANKLYTWSLGQPLPIRSALGQAIDHGQERPGVYLCRVQGRSNLPVTLPVWTGHERGFRKETRQAFNSLCILPQAEYQGLRALELKIEPLAGYVFTEHVSLAPFTQRLLAIQSIYPRGSAQHQVSKGLANALVGKLGERPERLDVCYSAEVPGSDWWPYLTWDNQVVPGLWVRTRYQPSAHQRIDAATVVTARARSRVYSWAAEWVGLGGQVVHIDTDGLVLTSDPTGLMPLDDLAPGAFRLEVAGATCTVLGRKSYSLGGRVYTAGMRGIEPEQLAIAHSGQVLVVEHRVLVPPWEQGPMYRDTTFTLGAHPAGQG